MSKPQRFRGESVNYDRPDWSHLLAMVGTELTGHFMWMDELELSDGTRVHAYKHRDTRRYFHIGVDGRTFFYDWDGQTTDDGPIDYVEMPRTRAIDAVFRGWGQMLPPGEARAMKALVDAAWDVASADGQFEIDPRELQLQKEFEERQDEAEAA